MAQNPENITERLADYIAGRLSDADARALEADAALDPTLAAELEFTKQLAAGLKSDPDAIPANDLGWARLSRALDQDRPTEQPQIGNGASQKLVFWRYAAAAMFAVAAVQTAVLVTPSDGPEDTYQLASESRDALQTRVMFATDATSDDITTLLVETHARIVDGPSAVGFFTIEFASEQDLHTGLDVFEANAHLVMTVQSN